MNNTLIDAVLIDDLNNVRFLLENGAEPNIPNKYGKLPLHEAVRQGYKDTVRLLLRYGADPDMLDNDGNTSLWHVGDRVDILRLLIANGANLEFQNMKKETILHQAVLDNNEAVVRVLLYAGMDPNIQDINGDTPLHDTVVNMSPHPKIINLLLKHDADPTIRNKEGDTPSDIARSYDSYLYNFGQLLDDAPL